MKNLFGFLFLIAFCTTLYFIWVAIKELLVAILMIFITWTLFYAAGGGDFKQNPRKKKP